VAVPATVGIAALALSPHQAAATPQAAPAAQVELAAASLPTPAHIVVVMEENHSSNPQQLSLAFTSIPVRSAE
jgi:acid phosphatase